MKFWELLRAWWAAPTGSPYVWPEDRKHFGRYQWGSDE